MFDPKAMKVVKHYNVVMINFSGLRNIIKESVLIQMPNKLYTFNHGIHSFVNVQSFVRNLKFLSGPT